MYKMRRSGAVSVHPKFISLSKKCLVRLRTEFFISDLGTETKHVFMDLGCLSSSEGKL